MTWQHHHNDKTMTTTKPPTMTKASMQSNDKTNIMTKQENLNWHHQNYLVLYIVEYCSQIPTRKPLKIIKPAFPFFIPGLLSVALILKCVRGKFKITWIHHWKTQFNTSWAQTKISLICDDKTQKAEETLLRVKAKYTSPNHIKATTTMLPEQQNKYNT